jgi:chromosomal replication initiator protein
LIKKGVFLISDDVIELLKSEVSEQEFNRYIKQLEYHEKASRNDLRVFIAPNILISNWVKTKYSKKIAHLFEVKTGKKPTIKIMLKDQISTSRKKTVPIELNELNKNT